MKPYPSSPCSRFARPGASALSFLLVCVALLALPGAAHAAPGDLEAFHPNVTGSLNYVTATAVLPDGRMIIGGSFTTVGGAAHANIARLNADGTVDATFTASINSHVNCVTVQADGKLVLGGFFTSVNGSTANHIARLNADGTLDTAFNTGLGGASDVVYSVAVQADGKLAVGGIFTSVNGSTMNRIARLNADGTLDTAFNAGLGGANNNVNSVAVQADGKLVLGGRFTSLNGSTVNTTTGVNRIARLNADGTLDTAFNAGLGGASGDVNCVAVQADGKLVLGGGFTSVNGSTVNRIARLNADGTLDTAFNASLGGANNNVYSVAVQADGKLVLGGTFTTVNGSVVNRIARLNADGTLDTAFDAGLGGANNNVYNVALQADGKLLVGGNFTSVNGATRNALARLTNDAATQNLSVPDNTQTLWTRGGAGPELGAVSFEQSTDGGSTWTPLGTGTRVGSTANWQLMGLSLTGTGQLRARGRTTNAFFNGGSGLIEQVTSFNFTVAPTVTSIAPTSGSTAGGTSVTITGTAFTGATAVTIGGTAATSVVVSNTTTITAVTPVHVAGTASVLVTTPGGTNAANTLYTYVAPTPEINVTGNSVNIADGDTTPSTADFTDFSSQLVSSGTVVRTFTIQNIGTAALNVTGITAGGDFAVGGITLPASIATSGSTTFTVTFDPTAVGLRTATVSIANNDADENPCTFAVEGTGVGFPEINLTGNGTSIVNGDAAASATDDTDFGSQFVPSATVVRTFTIQNTGNAALNVTGISAGGDFNVGGITLPASIAAAGSTTFTVTFDPSATGVRTATVSIANDDANENPYTFAIKGTGTMPSTVVTTTSDVVAEDGQTTLREAIINANTAPGSQVTFSSSTAGGAVDFFDGTPRTITLTGGQIEIVVNMNLIGPGARLLTVSGGGTSRIFLINDGNDVSNSTAGISGLTLANGNGAGENAPGAGGTNSTGGAIYCNENLTLSRCTVSGNSTQSGITGGGGGLVLNFGTSVIDACTISGNTVSNTSSHGGGLIISAGSVTLKNCTISGNTTGNSGGGALVQSSGSATFLNCTVVSNTASGTLGGGGLRVANPVSSLTLRNTIVAGNTCTGLAAGNDLTRSSGTLTGANCLIGDAGSAGGLVNGANGNLLGNSGSGVRTLSSIITTTLADNGGPTNTHALASGSAAIDVGSNTLATGLTLDQRGSTRVVNSTVDIGAYELDSAPSEINVQGNSITIASGDTTPNSTDFTHFDGVFLVGGTAVRTFTIQNTGSGPLNVSGITAGGDFTVGGISLPASIAAAGSTTFTVTFDPSALGLRSATLSIANNDADENPYTFTIQGVGNDPEINVTGNGVSIASGDITPQAGDDTEFGSVATVSGSITHIFKIVNTGSGTLSLTGTPRVALSGPNAADFTVTVQPPATLGTGTFNLAFDPSADGVRTATVTIANDDTDEGTYTFVVQGSGTSATVPFTFAGANLGGIPDQGSRDVTFDVTGLSSAVDQVSVNFTFSPVHTSAVDVVVKLIAPDGTEHVVLSHIGSPTNSGGGSAAPLAGPYTFADTAPVTPTLWAAGVNDFAPLLAGAYRTQPGGSFGDLFGVGPIVTTLHATFAGKAANGTWTLRFEDTLAVDTGTVSAASLSFFPGTLPAPEINVQGNSVSIASSDIAPSTTDFTDFGSQLVSSGTIVRTFTIQNTGVATLNVTGITAGGDFSVGGITLPASIAAAGSTTFTVTFDPSTAGIRTATMSIANDDSNENPYTFSIQGTGLNSTPTDIALTSTSIAENAGANVVVGTLSATDADVGQTQTFSLVVGTGDDDNTAFNISGSSLRLSASANFEIQNSYSVRIQTNDGNSGTFAEVFTITVTNVNEVPSFTQGANQTLAAGTSTSQTNPNWATAINDGDSTVTQTLTFSVTNDNNGLFTTQPAVASNGTLTYTPNGTAGTATVSVSLTDDNTINGNAALTSAVQSFTITVAAVADYTITTAAGVLTITDNAGNGDTLNLTEPVAGSIRFTASGRTFSVNGGASTNGSTSNLSLVGITNVTVNAASGTDTINMGAFTTIGGFPSLTINGGVGDDTVNLLGDITFASGASLDLDLQNDDATPGADRIDFATGADLSLSGTGAATLKASRSIALSTGTLDTVNGALTIEANQQAVPTSGTFTGVSVNSGGAIAATGTGVVTIKGKGGDSGSGCHGINLAGTISGGTTGTLTVQGAGGATPSSSSAYGIYVNGTTITSLGAAVNVTGTGGGSGASSFQSGVQMTGGTITSASAAAAVTITGTGGVGTGNAHHGIASNAASTISSGGGNVEVYGTGGVNGSGSNAGVDVGNLTITAGGSGTVRVQGTGRGATGSSSNYGVELRSLSTITSGGGSVRVIGQGGPGGGSHGILINTNDAFVTSGGGDVTLDGSTSNTTAAGFHMNLGSVSTATNGGDISVTADRMTLRTLSANSASTVTLAPRTAARAIGLGAADTTTLLGLTDTELDFVTAGTVQIGDSASGSITLSAAITRTPATDVMLVSSGDIAFTTGSIDTNGGDLNLDSSFGSGVIKPNASGTDVATATASGAGTLEINITGATVDTEYQQLKLVGSIYVDDMDLTLSGSYTPVSGNSFTLIDNDGTDAIDGTFAGLAQNSTLSFNGVPLRISYTGGDGNDVVLSVQPAPSVVISLSDSILSIGETPTVTFAFSEAVSGFSNDDVTSIPNGSLSPVTTANGGLTYTATFTPNASVEDATNVITTTNSGFASVASGLTGSGTSDSDNFTIDNVRPTLTSITVSDTALRIGETATISFNFSEPTSPFVVPVSITTANGTLTGLTFTNSGATWNLTLTPTASVTDATNVISINLSTVVDLSLNPGTGTADSPTYTIDTVRPTVSSILLADTSLTAGETTLVTLTFSEAVSSFTNTDLTVPNGAIPAVNSADGGITWTGTFTPNGGINDATNIITVDLTSLTDVEGNAGTGSADSPNFSINTTTPEINLQGGGTDIASGDTMPRSADGTDFGSQAVASGTITRTYTLQNTGTGALNLTGISRVSISGTHAADFTVSAQPGVASISPGNSVDFQVTFDPAAPGLRSATVSIANDDSDENPYTFAIEGTGTQDVSIATLNDAVVGGVDGAFNFTRTQSSGPLVVNFQLDASSTAVAGTDFTLSGVTTFDTGTGAGTVSFPDGVNSVTITLTALTESPDAAEIAETARLNVVASAGDYGVGASANSTVTIAANGFVVTTTADSGTGSLRQAILNANAIAGMDTITFDPTTFTTLQTITLATTLPQITSSLVINGTGAALLRVDGNDSVQVFSIGSGAYSVTMKGLTVRRGLAAAGGAGLSNASTSPVTLVGMIFENNYAEAGSGGGGIMHLASTLRLLNCLFVGNTADTSAGGGVSCRNSGSVVEAVNCTFTGNTASFGAGINAQGSGTTIRLINCTVTHNTLNSGGAINGNAGSTIILGNTLSAGNTGSQPDLRSAGTLTSLGNNLIGNATGVTGFVGSDLTGTTTSPLNAQLDALADNGGSTRTHALLAGSLAINAGNSALLPADTHDLDGDTNTTEPIPFDHRGTGFPRAIGTVDIGAYEAAPAPDLNVQGNSIDIADGSPTAGSVDDTVFGSQAVSSGSIVRTFTVQNTGTADLTLGAGSITLSGTHAADFAVGGISLPATLIPSGSTTFTVTFDPSAAGLRQATVSLASNDPDAENPYTFAIQGTGTAAPTLTSLTPPTGNILGGTTVTLTGTGFTGATAVTFNGAAATSVNVVSDTSLTAVTPAGSAGPASVLVTTPDGTNVPNTAFTYTTSLEIVVHDGSHGLAPELVDGQATPVDFGGTAPNVASLRSFTVRNPGTADLTLSSITVPSGYVTNGTPVTLAPGTTYTFLVALESATPATYAGSITIQNDGLNPTFDFPVTGTVVAPGSDPVVNVGENIAVQGTTGSAVLGGPLGSTLYKFIGSPALNPSGVLATAVQIRHADASLHTGMMVGQPMVLIATDTQTAPSLPGVTHFNFAPPIINETGHIAFIGEVRGPGITTNVNSRCLFSNASDGTLKLVAQVGMVTTLGSNLKTIGNFSIGGDLVIFLGTLVDNSIVLFGWDANTGIRPLMRNGQSLDANGVTKTVKSFNILETGNASSGHGKEISVAPTGESLVTLGVVFTDNSSGVVLGSFDGTSDTGFGATYGASQQLADTYAAPAVIPLAMWSSFRSPGFDNTGNYYGFISQMVTNTLAGVTSTNNVGLFVDTAPGLLTLQLRENDVATGTGGLVFSDFSDLVLGGGDYEFLVKGEVRGSGVITNVNDKGLWAQHATNGLVLVAREGSEAPGVAGSTFFRLTQIALPGTAQPMFQASMNAGVGGVTTANDTGLWVINEAGEVKLAVREGDVLDVAGTPRTVTAITALLNGTTTGGALGRRVFLADGQLTLLLTFSGGIQANAKVVVP